MFRFPAALRFGPQVGVTQHHTFKPGEQPAEGAAAPGGGMYFSEVVLYVAVFMIPMAIIVYFISQSLMHSHFMDAIMKAFETQTPAKK